MSSGRTALFVTCLVEQFFPQVREAAVALLEQVGCRLDLPPDQTCCGQPVFNAGYREEAVRLARRFISIFEPYDEIVAPSGSCTAMVRKSYPLLFGGDAEWEERARRVSGRTFELTEFLFGKGFEPSRSRFEGKVTYHDACHSLRELGIQRQPRSLLSKVPGLELVEMRGADVCCGFGGVFSVKMRDLARAMLGDKLAAATASGADVVTATDCGCLLHLRSALRGRRRKEGLRAVHIAEILAGRG